MTSSAIANILFYDGRLRDGILLSQRPCVVPELMLPPIMVLDCNKGRESKGAGSESYYNEQEATAAAWMVALLLQHGLPAHRVHGGKWRIGSDESQANEYTKCGDVDLLLPSVIPCHHVCVELCL